MRFYAFLLLEMVTKIPDCKTLIHNLCGVAYNRVNRLQVARKSKPLTDLSLNLIKAVNKTTFFIKFDCNNAPLYYMLVLKSLCNLNYDVNNCA